eukprot:snap_masked-scaffold_35-processed-gene-2.26-mRNA-1 protein AED:1.00 eAED:1.00 QI:0/0/0/0/1/1/4/0/308
MKKVTSSTKHETGNLEENEELRAFSKKDWQPEWDFNLINQEIVAVHQLVLYNFAFCLLSKSLAVIQKKPKSNDLIYECWASLYGLAVAGQVWYWKFVEVVKEFDLKPLTRCPSLFSCEKDGAKLWLVLYVDDFLIGSKDLHLMTPCEDFLLEKFKVRCTRAVKKIVGLQLDRGSLRVAIHQNEKIHDMGTRYRTTKFPSKPMIKNFKWNENSVALDNIKPLQKLFGELNHLSTMSRPDINCSVNRIARRLHGGTKEAYRRAKPILAYLFDTSNFVLAMKSFSGISKLELYCYDSFADDKLEKISNGGF